METKPAIDVLFEDVSQTFWIILFFYVVVSMAWIFYNVYIHHVELNVVETKIKQNGIARSLELQRLLEAYNRVNTSDPSSHTVEQV